MPSRRSRAAGSPGPHAAASWIGRSFSAGENTLRLFGGTTSLEDALPEDDPGFWDFDIGISDFGLSPCATLKARGVVSHEMLARRGETGACVD